MFRASNIERTGTRDLTFSTFVRHLPGVRHIDIDMVQVCPRCAACEVVAECSSSATKSTTYLRGIAERMRCVALYVRHEPHDLKLEGDVTVWAWSPETGYRERPDRHVVCVHGAWFAELYDFLLAVHTQHTEDCEA